MLETIGAFVEILMNTSKKSLGLKAVLGDGLFSWSVKWLAPLQSKPPRVAWKEPAARVVFMVASISAQVIWTSAGFP